MKKVFISALLLCSGIYGYSQLLSVTRNVKVSLPDGVTANTATIIPDGSYMVVSPNEKNGLFRLDLETSAVTTISETGTGFGLKISDDSKTVLFRESTIGKDRLRRTALKSADMATGRVATIVKPTRDLQGFAIKGATVMAMNKGKLTTKALSGVATVAPVVSIDKGRMMLTVNGETKVIAPQGVEGQSYLWPSISPDGTRIAYYLGRHGAYVCNIDGSNPVFLGSIRAPRWYNNDIVVGMNDKDNGQVVTSSKIVAAKADGTMSQALTDDASMAMYPTVSADGSKISYSTAYGEIHILEVK
ncbi:MAG: PD40 domain-containing protein [Muribaculaceae bacterium]|nr:PD40 domain-containing protein [Muribaculaceae bacterium]